MAPTARAVLSLDYAHVRDLAGGTLKQSQVNGINAITLAFSEYGDGNPRSLAYILATAFHETGATMQPVRETFASTDAKAKAILTNAWKAGKLKWVKADYWSGGFFGRGFVQLTHRANYERAGRAINADLVANPKLALNEAVAARIIVQGMIDGWFTGKKLADYPSDFKAARKIVNGTDRAALIAGYANVFLRAISVVGVEPSRPAEPEPVIRPEPIPPLGPPIEDHETPIGEPSPAFEVSWVKVGIAVAIGLAVLAFIWFSIA